MAPASTVDNKHYIGQKVVTRFRLNLQPQSTTVYEPLPPR